MIKKKTKKKKLSKSATNLLSNIKTDLNKWSKTKDGRNYKMFYQLEYLR